MPYLKDHLCKYMFKVSLNLQSVSTMLTLQFKLHAAAINVTCDIYHEQKVPSTQSIPITYILNCGQYLREAVVKPTDRYY